MTKFYFCLAPHIRLRVFVILISPLLVIVLYFAAIFLLEPPFSAETKMLNSRSFEMYWNESGQLDSLNCWLEKEKMTSQAREFEWTFDEKNSFEEINLKKINEAKRGTGNAPAIDEGPKNLRNAVCARQRVKTSFDSSLFVVNHVSLEWILIFKSICLWMMARKCKLSQHISIYCKYVSYLIIWYYTSRSR